MFISFIFFKYNFIFLEDFGFWLIIFFKSNFVLVSSVTQEFWMKCSLTLRL